MENGKLGMLKTAVNEMAEYIDNRPGTSYYDIKEVAYTTENSAWISALEDRYCRMIIADYAKSKRKKDGVSYNREYAEAYLAAIEAQTHYAEEQETKRLDAMEDSVEFVMNLRKFE